MKYNQLLSQSLLALLLIFSAQESQAAEYKGTLGKYPVHFSLNLPKPYAAVYFYDKHHQPISLHLDDVNSSGTNIILKEGLDYRKNIKTPSAEITLQITRSDNSTLIGTWKNLKTNDTLPIVLKQYDEPNGALQSDSFNKNYIRMNCEEGGTEKRVSLYSKENNALLQQIVAEGQCREDDIEVGDYNFDGFEDFAVFGGSFAGANTSSNYYLFDSNDQQYHFSEELQDVSLSFDSKNKTITSTNQCCAGTSTLITHYQWQGKKLKITGKECYRFSEKKGALVKAERSSACD